MVDASPPVALVTGSTSGIGRQTALGLARRGYSVVVTGRCGDRLEEAVEWVRGYARDPAHVSGQLLDLSDLDAIRGAAAAVKARHPRLDVLVNNAGGVNHTKTTTYQGFESTWGVNYLGHYLLTRLLLDAMPDAGRVVNVTSSVHWFMPRGLRLSDPSYHRRHYWWFGAYVASKLALATFTAELRRRGGPTAIAIHPGLANTAFVPDNLIGDMQQRLKIFFPMAEQAAGHVVHCATSDEAAKARTGYFAYDKPRRMAFVARDERAGKALWEHSALSVGLEP